MTAKEAGGGPRMTRPAATTDDIRWLLGLLRDPSAVGQRPSAAQRSRLARCEDFLVTALDVREAQRTKNGSTHHDRFMETYYAAVADWEAKVEACGWPAERKEFIEANPRPLLKDMMRAHASRHQATAEPMVCPECGALIEPITAAAA